VANRKLRIVYRSNFHAPFWLVADKSASWQKNGLDVDTSPQLVREKAVEALKSGHVDLISWRYPDDDDELRQESYRRDSPAYQRLR